VEQNVFDILQPDIMVADGVTGFREIAAMAKAHNKRVIPHHGFAIMENPPLVDKEAI
jgi:L-alanine-DL-glutamate epimerase-like enolase superfamily enzyme